MFTNIASFGELGVQSARQYTPRHGRRADRPAKPWLNILMMFNLCVLCGSVLQTGSNCGRRAAVGGETVREGGKSYLSPNSVAGLVQVIWGCGGGAAA